MPINRNNLVARHRIRLTQPDAQSPLSAGNGEFAFTADITGLQTFPEFHQQNMQLGAQAQWGWHTMPNPAGYQLADTLTAYPTARGPVTYPDQYEFMAPRADQAAGAWLFQNPQRIDLGQIGLDFRRAEHTAAPITITDISDTQQTLDLWQGLLESSFRFDDQPVHVLTVCHPSWYCILGPRGARWQPGRQGVRHRPRHAGSDA